MLDSQQQKQMENKTETETTNYFFFGVVVPNVARPGIFGVPTKGQKGTTVLTPPPCKLVSLQGDSRQFLPDTDRMGCAQRGREDEEPLRWLHEA